MSYVGTHSDTGVVSRDLPYRVLVVAMSDGGRREHVSLVERRSQIGDSAALSFHRRNPHMRGVTLALRLAFGRPLIDDRTGEYLSTQQGQVHLFDAFAMANLTLCSAVATGTNKDQATAVMREECLQHLRATIGILEPTLIISQGATLRRPLQKLFQMKKSETYLPTELVQVCHMDDAWFVWVDLYHPAHGNWDGLDRPYLRDVAAPAIREGRRRALALAAVRRASPSRSAAER